MKGARVKGWALGSSYQATDQSGWEFTTVSKKLAFQVKLGFFIICKGSSNDCLYNGRYQLTVHV